MITVHYYDPGKGLVAALGAEDLRGLVREGKGMLWVDLESPTDEETALLDDPFAFHPLAIEDCREDVPYPKLDDFERYVFLVMLAPDLLGVEQEDPVMLALELFVGKSFVVTYHKRPLKCVTQLRARVETPRSGGRAPGQMMAHGGAFLAHAILDALVDQHYAVVARLDDAAERYEDLILEEPKKETLDGVLALRSHVLQLRRILADERNLMSQLSRGDAHVVGEDAARYYSDLSEHLDQLGDKLEVARDSLAGARDLYLSVSANRTNETMRALAIIATIVMPLMFVTGIYGMNISLPGGSGDASGGDPTTFLVLLGVMAAIAAGFFGYFRWRRWI